MDELTTSMGLVSRFVIFVCTSSLTARSGSWAWIS